MRSSVLRLVLSVVLPVVVAFGAAAGNAAIDAKAVATGGPTCWDWTLPDL